MRNKYVTVARRLRKQQTPHEIKLWSLLRRRHFKNLKFRRQYPIGKYIVDFCCFGKKLIIELDGGGHTEKEQVEKDKIRDKYLKDQGFEILRVWNNELDDNLEGVFERIYQLVSKK